MTRTLNGTASLNAHDGALVGINVEQLLQRLEKRPLSGNGDFRTGSTAFDRLALNVKIDQGLISVQRLEFHGPAVKLQLAGEASIPSRDLDLQGTATLVSANSTDDFALPFTVQGPWDSPVPLPDASSLIRHSNAAAPLLEAVKRHSAGDAVRSVIDQLFAAPHATSSAPVPPTRRDRNRPCGVRIQAGGCDRPGQLPIAAPARCAGLPTRRCLFVRPCDFAKPVRLQRNQAGIFSIHAL